MTSSKDPDFTNLAILYSGECPRIDIIVVENLGERPFQSWTYQKEGRVVGWLQDPVFRVFSFGYEVTKKSYPKSLAKSLLQKLRKARLAAEVFPSLFNFIHLRLAVGTTYRTPWCWLWWNYLHEGIPICLRRV